MFLNSLILFSNLIYAQIGDETATLISSSYEGSMNYRALTLSEMIEQGLRKNFDELDRNLQKRFLLLTGLDIQESFWLPKLSLTLQTEKSRVGTLYNGSKDEGKTSKSTQGALAVGFDDYTLFNWGKDYLAYKNEKDLNKRTTDELTEKRRTLRHELISRYYERVFLKEVEAIKKNHLRQASFIYRVSSERAANRKMTKQQYYQSRTLYLESQTALRSARINSNNADESLSLFIADPAGTRFNPTNGLDYQKIKVTAPEAITLATERNSDIKTAETLLNNSKREYQIAERENLPLPKFTMNLGAYTYGFSNGRAHTEYTTSENNSNVEVVGAINATWTLFGEDGFLNNRKIERALIQKEIAENGLNHKKHQAESLVRLLYQEILLLQDQYAVYEVRKENAQKTYDTILENYLAGQSQFNDLEKAMNDSANINILMAELKKRHLNLKLQLASAMGVDDFPGENFELLATKAEDPK